MKQQHPNKLEAAVLEIESYLNPKATTAGCIAQVEADPGTQSLVAAVQMKQDAMMDMLTQMMGRLEKERSTAPQATVTENLQKVCQEDEKKTPLQQGIGRHRPATK